MTDETEMAPEPANQPSDERAKPSQLRARLQTSGRRAVGSFVLGHDAGVVRVAEAAGLDFLLLDREHGTVTDELIAQFVDVRRGLNVSLLVRTSIEDIHAFGRWFDHGLDGVIVAGAQSTADVAAIVAAVKYAPLGNRGLNPFVPATNYGNTPPDAYMLAQNQSTLVWVIAENQQLLGELPEICKLPGLDGVFFGPYDLSVDLGVPGQVNHPAVTERIETAIAVLKDGNKFSGIYSKDTVIAETWRAKGANLLTVGFDWSLLRTAWTQAAALRVE